MKNLIIFVFSLLFAISCKQESFKEATLKQGYNQYGNPNFAPDSTDGWQVTETVALDKQNYVADTSYTAVPSAIESANQIARMLDDNAYQASIINDRLEKSKKEALKSIAKWERIKNIADSEYNNIARRIKLNHEQETLVAHEPNN